MARKSIMTTLWLLLALLVQVVCSCGEDKDDYNDIQSYSPMRYYGYWQWAGERTQANGWCDYNYHVSAFRVSVPLTLIPDLAEGLNVSEEKLKEIEQGVSAEGICTPLASSQSSTFCTVSLRDNTFAYKDDAGEIKTFTLVFSNESPYQGGVAYNEMYNTIDVTVYLRAVLVGDEEVLRLEKENMLLSFRGQLDERR